jgi:hypothetical protein
MTLRVTLALSLALIGCTQPNDNPVSDLSQAPDLAQLPDLAPPPGVCGNGVVEGDELCDDSLVVGCNSLGAVWASGSAHCRADCAGYDVTACTLSAQLTEAVFPVNRDGRWTDALCNDGSPFAFDVHMAPTKTDKWVIYVEGGGSCDPTYQGCGGRGTALISSSLELPDRGTGMTINIDGTIMSRDSATNPDFYDANIAFGRYCSSDGWTGTNTTPQPVKGKNGAMPLFTFAGRNNLRAYIAILFRNYGVNDDTSEVLFAGNSAGGYGAGANVDLIAGRMPKATADGRLAMIVSAAWNSGLWNDSNYTDYGSGKTDQQVADDLTASYQASANPRCIALALAKGSDVSACAAGPLVYAGAAPSAPDGWGVRTFITKNRLDQGPMSEHGIPTADATNQADLDARATWLTDMTQSMANVAWLYAPADPQLTAAESNLHGILTDPLVWTFTPPGYPTSSLREMVSRFWAARTPGAQGERVQFDGAVPHTDKANN